MIKTTEYRMGRQRTVNDKPLRATRANDPVYLGTKLLKADSTQARRVLVSEAMGEFFYIFGEERRAWKDWLSYEENMNDNETN